MSNTIRIEPLRKDNYDTWCVQAQAVLIKSDLWAYASGEKTLAADAAADVKAKFDQQDLLARSELLLLMSPAELRQVKSCKTSKELWDKLKETYQSQGPARKATLLKQLILKKMAENEDVRDHLNNFMDTVDKLANMGIDLNQDLLSIMMLYSLPATYENFRIAVESRDHLPIPEDLKIKIIEESEARRQNSHERNEGEGALYSRKSQRCQNCGKRGHATEACWSKPRKSPPRDKKNTQNRQGVIKQA